MNKKKFHLSIMVLFFLLFIGSGVVFSGEYDIRHMTPEIQGAISGRQARYGQLEQLKSSGAIGENNQGFVQGLDGSSATASLVNAENDNRQVIYQAIVDQNGLGVSGMVKVQQVFAEVQREKAQSGQMIQLVSGEWARK